MDGMLCYWTMRWSDGNLDGDTVLVLAEAVAELRAAAKRNATTVRTLGKALNLEPEDIKGHDASSLALAAAVTITWQQGEIQRLRDKISRLEGQD